MKCNIYTNYSRGWGRGTLTCHFWSEEIETQQQGDPRILHSKQEKLWNENFSHHLILIGPEPRVGGLMLSHGQDPSWAHEPSRTDRPKGLSYFRAHVLQ